MKCALEIEIVCETVRDSDYLNDSRELDAEILANFLIISKAKNRVENAISSFKVGNLEIFIAKSTLFKCEICWRYLAENEDGLCDRCAKIV